MFAVSCSPTCKNFISTLDFHPEFHFTYGIASAYLTSKSLREFEGRCCSIKAQVYAFEKGGGFLFTHINIGEGKISDRQT
jgi:hypothetical protein